MYKGSNEIIIIIIIIIMIIIIIIIKTVKSQQFLQNDNAIQGKQLLDPRILSEY